MAKGPKDQAVSERLPVARVAVDISLAHLDRPFDYLVPARLDAEAVPGCRVRVRFAGQLVDGYLLERTETSEHQGKLARLERVISPEPVLTPEIFDLARAVADRYAGTLADVLRLAIPPRHATAEREKPRSRREVRLGARDRASRAQPRRTPAPGAAIPPGRRSWPAWPRAARSGPPGRRCPARHRQAGMARRDRRGRRHHGRRGPRRGHRRAGRPRPGPRGRRPDRGRPGPRLPDRGPRPGRAVPALAGGAPGPGPRGRGHQGRDVRPGRRARPGGALGRRRRSARRAARAVPERPRGACPARPPDRCGRADRGLRPHRRAHPAGRGRLGPAAGRRARRRSGRRRPGSGPRPTRPNWPGTPRR